MITTEHEFKTIDAWTHIAGCSLGTWTKRETTVEMIKILEKCTNVDCSKLWRDLAECEDHDEYIIDMQQECADLINEWCHIAPYCSVSIDDNEWRVIPYIDDDLPRLDEVPECLLDDCETEIYVINDHGNVTFYCWDDSECEYKFVWGMV